MSGPLGVMSVLLLETAVGGAVVLWATGVWDRVRRGFILLTGVTVALAAWGAWATARAGVAEVAAAGDPASRAVLGPAGDRLLAGLLVFAGLATAWQILVLVGPAAGAHALGLLATAAGLVAMVLYALARGERELLALLELLLGALFLGSALFGLLLGHWYLVERRLPTVFMIRSAWWYAAGVAAAGVAAVLSAGNPTAPATGFSPFLAVPNFTLYLAAGLVAVCALIAAFVWRLAYEGGRSIQAATGLFYLAVIMAFSAELAIKYRFF